MIDIPKENSGNYNNRMTDASQDTISTLQDKHHIKLHPIPFAQSHSSIQVTTKKVGI